MYLCVNTEKMTWFASVSTVWFWCSFDPEVTIILFQKLTHSGFWLNIWSWFFFFLGPSYDFYLFILVLIYSLYLYRPNSNHIYRQRNLYWIFFYLDLPNYISSPDNVLILTATIQHCITVDNTEHCCNTENLDICLYFLFCKITSVKQFQQQ